MLSYLTDLLGQATSLKNGAIATQLEKWRALMYWWKKETQLIDAQF